MPTLLKEHENQRKNCQKREKTKLEILAAIEKPVELPEILSQRHDGDQNSREQNE